MFGQRNFSRVLKALLKPHSYEAGIKMAFNYVNPVDGFLRYVFGVGKYPCDFQVKTPVGVVTTRLYSKHDILTVNEIFCREDYYVPSDVSTVLDIGANIGLSALYFLTRNSHSIAYVYEPVPKNIEKLRNNLQGLEDRFFLTENAVSDVSGEFQFGVEPSGRYGGLEKKVGEKASAEQPLIDNLISVQCDGINQVLEKLLDKHDQIDLIKIDTEGAELKTVEAINEENLARIKMIYIEAQTPPILKNPAKFRIEKYKTVLRITNLDFLD